MRYDFLVETYATERIKVLSTWSEVRDEEMQRRPKAGDPRGRNFLEHMVHQCVSENLWFKNMLAIDVNAPPLPASETRIEFLKRYAEDSEKRSAALHAKDDAWWEEQAKFFDVDRSRAWVMTRRIAHTAHHRGQQIACGCWATRCTAITARPRTPEGSCKITLPRFTHTKVSMT
jgi:uncharacterized damage-inducible protein DinB